MSAWSHLGQTAYLAFAGHAARERGVKMIPWGAMPADVQSGWAEAARAVCAQAAQIAADEQVRKAGLGT